MENIVAFQDFAGPSGPGGRVLCWLCHRETPHRAMFCAQCGSIQPVRDMDHFSRLGIDRRIDVDMTQLEKQYAIHKHSLDPQKYASRGLGERTHATRQLEAVETAYAVLREPVSRGRYWLSLHKKDDSASVSESVPENSFLDELRRDLETASDPSQCDRVAQVAGKALTDGVMGLMQALRAQNWKVATATLAEIDGLENILGSVRSRRSEVLNISRNKN